MNAKEIEDKLRLAIENLFNNQKDFFNHTSESNVTEWNIAHHLAFEIQSLFPEYQHDIELIKTSYKNKRPDIILHERGNNNNNFLVIEVKYQNDYENDINKIRDNWFKSRLCYTFGATIRIDSPDFYDIKVLKNKEKKLEET